MRTTNSKWIALVLCLFVLVGCKEELYSNIEENEANQMLAILLQNGIDADKVLVKDNLVNIEVDKSNVASAITLLNSKGFPRIKHEGLAAMFQKDGLISTPAEERARYIYGLSQELSQTLMDIDGVVAARVHLVLPNNEPQNENALPSSAAVLIKHDGDPLVGDLVPQIKELVTNSIEGLSYEKVAVILFEHRDFGVLSGTQQLSDVLGIMVDPQSETRLWVIIGALMVLIVVVFLSGGYIVLSRSRHRVGTEQDG